MDPCATFLGNVAQGSVASRRTNEFPRVRFEEGRTNRPIRRGQASKISLVHPQRRAGHRRGVETLPHSVLAQAAQAAALLRLF
jgi:hypothetical protein